MGFNGFGSRCEKDLSKWSVVDLLLYQGMALGGTIPWCSVVLAIVAIITRQKIPFKFVSGVPLYHNVWEKHSSSNLSKEEARASVNGWAWWGPAILHCLGLSRSGKTTRMPHLQPVRVNHSTHLRFFYLGLSDLLSNNPTNHQIAKERKELTFWPCGCLEVCSSDLVALFLLFVQIGLQTENKSE